MFVENAIIFSAACAKNRKIRVGTALSGESGNFIDNETLNILLNEAIAAKQECGNCEEAGCQIGCLANSSKLDIRSIYNWMLAQNIT